MWTAVALLLAAGMVVAGVASGAWLVVIAGVLLAIVYGIDSRPRRS